MSPSFDVPSLINEFTLAQAHAFKLTRVLSNDPLTRTIFLLGTLPLPSQDGEGERKAAIVKMEKTSFDVLAFSQEGSMDAGEVLVKGLEKVDGMGGNDIYAWATGWFGEGRGADVKMMVIFPATETHIRKYTTQNTHLIHETPALYSTVHAPYIASIPASRTKWVENIVAGVSEADAVIYRTPESEREAVQGGFLMVPDAKWDRKTLSDLYVTCISHSAKITSLRALDASHLPLLRAIRSVGETQIMARYPDIEQGQLRFFVHYLPSYYHFHVHVTHIAYSNPFGMSVGQAHLLDNIIALIEVCPTVFQSIPLTYTLGEQHPLWPTMSAAKGVVDHSAE